MIDICLATYNGEKYLATQLNSIVAQTYSNWHLWIRDDGSSDSTLTILKQYKEEHTNIITIIEDNKGNLGYNKNFLEILDKTNSGYIAFCDQDDIWLPEKLECLYKEIVRVEGNEKYVPIIVHSDFDYLNQGTLYPKERSLDKRVVNNRNILKIIFHQGCLLGCTCMINRAMVKMTYGIPENSSIGYDIYFLAVSSIIGKYSYINRVLIHHQIHASNTSSVGKRAKFIPLFLKAMRFEVSSLAAQKIVAQKILSDYYLELRPAVREALSFVSDLDKKSFLKKVFFYLNHKLFSVSLNGAVTFLRLILNK